MKIGLTIDNLAQLDKLANFFSNGLNQHLFTLKNYLENNNEVFLISNNNSIDNKYKFISSKDDNSIANLDIIICVGLIINNKNIKSINPNVKTVFYSMGNVYQCDIYNMLELNGASSIGDSYFSYDEIWISPQFEYAIDYYKYKYNTENVYIAPFFWSNRYIRDFQNKIMKFTNDVHIAVFESNICKDKNFVIPMIACEKAKDYISTAKMLNTADFRNSDLLNFFNRSSLYKEGKLTGEKRWPFTYIMSDYCNIVISYVENWDLNYLYLECFYLGIPLIHNSKMLKDYGYYYEGCDATKAAEHIKNLKVNGFDREAYIAKHKEVLFKYSLENPRVTNFLDKRLLSNFNASKTNSNLNKEFITLDKPIIVKNYHKNLDAIFYIYKNCFISNILSKNKIWEKHMHIIFDKYISKDSVVLEGGCHIGSHTIKLGMISKKVYAFEPLDFSFDLLNKNIKLNNLTNIEVYKKGLSDKLGYTYFDSVRKNNSGASILKDSCNDIIIDTLKKYNSKDELVKIDNKKIKLVTIDSLGLKKLDFIKLDVEGFEKLVILGGLTTIKKYKPIITLECYCWELIDETKKEWNINYTSEKFKILLDIGYSIEHIYGPDYLFIHKSHKNQNIEIVNNEIDNLEDPVEEILL